VSALQNATPMARSHLRFHTSARCPKGTPIMAYRRVKAVPNTPSWVSLRPHSLRIGSVIAARIWRSKKFMVLTAKSNHNANRQRVRSRSIQFLSSTPLWRRVSRPP
jgi:hypothetical protein